MTLGDIGFAIQRKGSDTEVIRLPPQSPNLNAYAERFVRSIKEECLDRMIFVGQASLRRAVAEYMDHYHRERNHQGLENRLIRASAIVAANDGAIYRYARLVGILNFYYRKRREQCRSNIWMLRAPHLMRVASAKGHLQ